MSPVHLDYWGSLCYSILEYFKVLNRKRNDCRMLKPGPGGRWHIRWQLLSVTFQSLSSASTQVPRWKLLQRAMKAFENWNLPVWKCETKVQQRLLSTADCDYELSKSRSVRHINAVSQGLFGRPHLLQVSPFTLSFFQRVSHLTSDPRSGISGLL